MTGLYTRTIPFKNACTEIGWYPVANADLRVLVDFVRFFFVVSFVEALLDLRIEMINTQNS